MGWLSLQVALLCACHEHIVKCQQGNSTALWDCVCRLSCFSRVRLFATLWTVAYQAHLSVGFSRQEYWSGLPCPLPGYLLNSGIEPRSFMSSALAGGLTSCRCQVLRTQILIELHRDFKSIYTTVLWDKGRSWKSKISQNRKRKHVVLKGKC